MRSATTSSQRLRTCDSGRTPTVRIAAHSLLNADTQCFGVGSLAVWPPGVSIGALSTCSDAAPRPQTLRWVGEAPASR